MDLLLSEGAKVARIVSTGNERLIRAPDDGSRLLARLLDDTRRYISTRLLADRYSNPLSPWQRVRSEKTAAAAAVTAATSSLLPPPLLTTTSPASDTSASTRRTSPSI